MFFLARENPLKQETILIIGCGSAKKNVDISHSIIFSHQFQPFCCFFLVGCHVPFRVGRHV